VGVCLVEAYGYPQGAVDRANSAISRLLTSKEMAVVAIDTRLDCNAVGLRSPSEVEALLARMDVVVTTRLHGMVLALKNGVPVVAIDPQTGGGKILRQAKAIGWPFALREDTLTDDALLLAFEYCLTPAAQLKARECATLACEAVKAVHDQLISALAQGILREQAQNSLKAARSMAANLAPVSPRPLSPDMLPAVSEVVFQRAARARGPSIWNSSPASASTDVVSSCSIFDDDRS
jgi:polysaccharide pyruvyl transferase WcaK-like protein